MLNKDTKLYSILHAVDIFAFLPVPKTEPVSTKRSMCGSLLFALLFLAYFIYQLVVFFKNNPPSFNQYYIPLDPNLEVSNYPIAFGFYNGTNLSDTSINFNPDYFTIKLERKIKFYNQTSKQFEEEKIPVNLKKCKPDWIGQDYDILCPDLTDSDPLIMKGQLYSSELYQYPAITLKTCINKPNCKSQDELKKLFAGGRFFFYMKKPNSVNYATGETTESNKQFYLYQYFLINGLYNRNEIVIQYKETKKNPDFATQFKQEVTGEQLIVNQFSYVSDVTPNQDVSPDSPSYVFQVWLRLADDTLVNIITYKTSMDMVSGIGAFVSVIFSAFAVYFLRYNRTKFYNRNPDWDQFDRKIDKFDIDQSVQYENEKGLLNNIQQE